MQQSERRDKFKTVVIPEPLGDSNEVSALKPDREEEMCRAGTRETPCVRRSTQSDTGLESISGL